MKADAQIADDIAGFYQDPLGYVMYAFPWDDEPAIQELVPDIRLVKVRVGYLEEIDLPQHRV